VLLTVTTTHEPASDLGYLLHYPEATESRCTVALLPEVDPVGLVRGPKGRGGFALGQYVNDRPYAASSMLSVALGRVFWTAMAGRCDSRPELAAMALALEIHAPALAVLARRGDAGKETPSRLSRR
jgi:hypothetical protein